MFRTGVAPLRVEAGRYASLQLEQRVCFNCIHLVEGEKHVLIDCPAYEFIRKDLYSKATSCENRFMTEVVHKSLFLAK